MALLTPDFGLLFWMLISFGIVFFVLAKAGFPIITRMVDKRRDYIQKSLEVADEANRKLESIKEESDRILAEAHRKQAELVKNAMLESEKIVRNAQARATEETNKQLDAAEKRIEAMKTKALSDVNSHVAMLSVDIAEKILRREVAGKENQEALVVEMLKEAKNVKRQKS